MPIEKRVDAIEQEVKKVCKILNGNGENGLVTNLALLNQKSERIENGVDEMKKNIISHSNTLTLHNEFYKDIKGSMVKVVVAVIISIIVNVGGLVFLSIKVLSQINNIGVK